MKIKKLILENVKSYEHAEFDFENGINFVSGKNGAGKTTIIESIGFALFNYKIVENRFADYYITRMKTKATVFVLFEAKDLKEYIVERKISLKPAENSWSIKDAKTMLEIVSKDDEVKAWLKNNLGFYEDDNISDIYKNIISVPQGEYTNVFLASDNERKQKFDPIFNLESYKKIYTNTLEMLKGLNDKIIELDKKVSNNLVRIDNLNNVKEKLLQVSTELENKKSESKKLNDNLILENEIYNKLENEKTNFEKVINEIKILETKKDSYDININNKKEDIEHATISKDIVLANKSNFEQYTKLEEEKSSLENKVSQYNKLKSENDEILKNIEIKKQKLVYSSEHLDTYNKEYELNDIKLETVLKEMKELEEKIQQEKEELEEKDLVFKELKELKEIVSKCCNLKEVANMKYVNIIKEKENKENELSIKPVIEKDICNLKEKVKDEIDIKEKLEICKTKLSQNKNEQKNIDIVISNLANGICPYLKEQCKNLDKNNILQYKQEKDELIDKAKELEENIKGYIKLQKEIELNKDTLATKNALLNSLLNVEKGKVEIDEKFKYIQLEIDEVDKKLQDNLDRFKNITKCKEEIIDINSLNIYVNKISDEINNLNIIYSNNNLLYCNKTEKKEEIVSKKEKLSNQINDVKDEISVLEKDLNDNNTKLKEKEESLTRYKIYELKYKEIEESLKIYFDGYMLYQQNMQQADKYEILINELNNLEKEIKEIISDIDKLNKTKESFEKKFDINSYNKSKLKVEQIKKELSAINAILQIQEKQKSEYETELEKVKKIEDEIKTDNENIKKINKAIKDLGKIRNIINEAPKYISRVLIKKIGEKAANIYSNIALDNTKLEWQEGYSIVLYDNINGNKICKEFKQLSGGEQMSAALSIRIAMLQTMTKLHIGILDEPTTNMDGYRRARLAEIIEDIGKEFVQLIVVSHDDTFNSITDNIIELDNLK